MKCTSVLQIPPSSFDLDELDVLCPADGAMALVTSALQSNGNLQTPRDVIRTCSFNYLQSTCCASAKFSFNINVGKLNSAACRTLEEKLTPVFAKYHMEFKCEMVDSVPCQPSGWLISKHEQSATAC